MEASPSRHDDPRQARRVVRHYSRLAPAYDRRWDRYSRGSLGKLVERLHCPATSGSSMLPVVPDGSRACSGRTTLSLMSLAWTFRHT